MSWWCDGLIKKFNFNGCEAKYHEQILAHVSLYHGICFHPGIKGHPEECNHEGSRKYSFHMILYLINPQRFHGCLLTDSE